MKKIINLVLMSLMVILMAGIVHGACNCDVTNATTTVGTGSTYIKGTTNVVEVTIACTNAIVTAENATAGVLTASPGTITGALSFNITALQSNQTKMNFTVNTMQLVDTVQQTFSIAIKNDTTQQTLATCTETFYSDNTKPVYSDYSPSDGSEDSDGTVDFSVTCANTSSAMLYVEDEGWTMTESSDVCTATVPNLRNSLQSWYVVGSDGLNSTTSLTKKVEIRKGSGVVIRNGQATTGAAQAATQAPTSTGINGLLNDLIKFPLKLLNGILGAIVNIFPK